MFQAEWSILYDLIDIGWWEITSEKLVVSRNWVRDARFNFEANTIELKF
jgi:hypothetical protein